MTRWEYTKYINDSPTLMERIYALIFIAPADILLPGNEWRNSGKSIYQRKIEPARPKLTLLKLNKEPSDGK